MFSPIQFSRINHLQSINVNNSSVRILSNARSLRIIKCHRANFLTNKISEGWYLLIKFRVKDKIVKISFLILDFDFYFYLQQEKEKDRVIERRVEKKTKKKQREVKEWYKYRITYQQIGWERIEQYINISVIFFPINDIYVSILGYFSRY